MKKIIIVILLILGISIPGYFYFIHYKANEKQKEIEKRAKKSNINIVLNTDTKDKKVIINTIPNIEKAYWSIITQLKINFSKIWFKVTINKKDNKWINVFPNVEVNNINVLKAIMLGFKIPVKEIDFNNEKELKKLWVIKKDNKYYLIIWLFMKWKENFCNDGVDNDGDWLVDSKDANDCRIAYILYDEGLKKTNPKKDILKKIKNKFFLWYTFKFIDYNKNKKTYADMLSVTRKDLWLPLVLFDKKINYNKYYTEILDKNLKQTPIALDTTIDWKHFNVTNYITLKLYDPINKKKLTSIYKRTSNISEKEIQNLGTWYAVYGNKKSDKILNVFACFTCPFCRSQIQDIEKNKDKLLTNMWFRYIPFPIMQHGQIALDSSIFYRCVTENKDMINKEKLDFLFKANKIPDLTIKNLSNILSGTSYIKEIEKCYSNNYTKYWKEILDNEKKYMKEFQITGTPTMVILNKKDKEYGIIDWFIPKLVSKILSK